MRRVALPAHRVEPNCPLTYQSRLSPGNLFCWCIHCHCHILILREHEEEGVLLIVIVASGAKGAAQMMP